MNQNFEKSKEKKTIILVGSTGTGKSYLGNLITRKDTFAHSPSMFPVTKEMAKLEFYDEVLSMTVEIVDTPDFFNANEPHKILSQKQTGKNYSIRIIQIRKSNSSIR